MNRPITNPVRPISAGQLAAVSTRSPLRYPGGKTRAVSQVMKLIPSDTDVLCSPFFGGGSVELSCASNGMRVYGYDNFPAVVDFWEALIKKPDSLYQKVWEYFPLSRDEFYAMQKSFGDLSDPIEKAAVFYVLNRASYSGITLSGGMSPGHPRFTENSIERLRQFNPRNLSVGCMDFKDSLKRHKTIFFT